MISHSTVKQVSSLISVLSLNLLEGLRIGWLPSITAVSFGSGSTHPVNEDNISWITLTEHVGKILFVVLFSFFITRASRKKILLISNFSLVLGWWLLYLSDSLESIIISQIVISMGSVLFEAIACTYIGEVTSPRNRTILLSIALFLTCAGTEIQFTLQMFHDYRFHSLVPLVIAVLCLIISPFTVLESPYHLIMNGGHEEAMKILSTLYVDESSTHIITLYEDLQKYAETENTDEMNYSQFFSTMSNTKAFVFICTIYSLMHVSTHYTFLTFGPIIMQPYTTEVSVDFVMNAIGGLIIVSVIIAPFIVDSASRYFLLASGFASTTMFQIALGMLFWLESFGDENIAIVPTIIVTLIVMLVILHNLTVFPAVQILSADLFPRGMEIRGNCIMIVLRETALILSRGLFLPMAIAAGIGSTFILYAVVSFAAFQYVCSFYKEARDKISPEIRYEYTYSI